MIDLKLDIFAQKSDNICIVETWLDPEKQCIENMKWPEKTFDHVSVGKGKGCGIFSPLCNTSKIVDKVKRENFQLLSITDDNVQLILTYISSNCQLTEVVSELKLITKKNKITIITGDFNFDKSNQNILTKYLANNGMVQLVSKPTHDAKNCIDHCYVPRSLKDKIEIRQHSPYYSDHDALCIKFNF